MLPAQDPNYEPTDQQIREYAVFLGMNPSKDTQFLWIARDALKAPLPEGWTTEINEEGFLCYINQKTGAIMQQHPMDTHFRKVFLNEKAKKKKEETTSSKEDVQQ